MGQKSPKNGAELYAWLESTEAALKGFRTPSFAVFDGVMSYLKVGTDTDIKGVANAQQIEGAWANARQFVKLQADLSAKQPA